MILKIKNTAFPLLMAILSIAGIFFGEEIVPYIIIVLIVSLFFEKDKGINYHSNKHILTPFIIAIFVFITYTLLSPDLALALKVLERQTSMLLIPVLVVFVKWDKQRIVFFFKVFVSVTFLIGIDSIIRFIKFILFNSNWISHMAVEKGSKLLYLQYKFPHVIGAHPTYWSYIIICSIIILWSNKNMSIFKNKLFVIGLLLFFNVNLVVLSSRTPLLINLLIHIFFLLRYLNKEKISLFKKLIISLVFLSLVFCGLQLPLLSNKLDIVKSDERLYYWSTAYNAIKHNFFILGEGLGQSNEIVKKEILENGDQRIRYTGYDLHNQYLRVYVDMGILGILSLGILLLYPLFTKKDNVQFGSTLYIPFLLLFSIGLITEAYLFRLKGIVFFATFSSILYLCAFGIEEKDKHRINNKNLNV